MIIANKARKRSKAHNRAIGEGVRRAHVERVKKEMLRRKRIRRALRRK